MPMNKWDACAFKIDEDDLEGRVCYGGLDLSSTTGIPSCGGTWTTYSSVLTLRETSRLTKQKARRRLTGRLPLSWLLTVLFVAEMMLEKVCMNAGVCWFFNLNALRLLSGGIISVRFKTSS